MNDYMLDAIDQAELPAPIFRTAVRLARHCVNSHGATFSYDEIAAICGTDNDNTVRGHLSKLHQAGLFNYSRKHIVTVWWVGPTGIQRAVDNQIDRTPRDLIAQRSEPPTGAESSDRTARDSRDTRSNRALDDHGADDALNQRALDDQIDRTARDSRDTRSNRALDDHPITTNTTTGRKEGHPTYLPTLDGGAGETTPETAPESLKQPADHLKSPQSASTPDARSVQRSIDLLTDEEVGLDRTLAQQLAKQYPFEEIRRQVFRLRRDIQAGSARSPGALTSRLHKGYSATITSADRQSALWERHETAEDREADYSWRFTTKTIASGLDSSPAAAPKPKPGTPEAIWQQLQSDFALHQPVGSSDSIIQDAWVVAYDDGLFTIGINNALRLDWIEKKLRNQIKRRLAVIMKRSDADVKFVVNAKSQNMEFPKDNHPAERANQQCAADAE